MSFKSPGSLIIWEEAGVTPLESGYNIWPTADIKVTFLNIPFILSLTNQYTTNISKK